MLNISCKWTCDNVGWKTCLYVAVEQMLPLWNVPIVRLCHQLPSGLGKGYFHFFQYCTSLSRACLLSCSPEQCSHHSLRLMSRLRWCNLPHFVPAHMKDLTIAMKNSSVLAVNYVHIFASQTVWIPSEYVWTSAFISVCLWLVNSGHIKICVEDTQQLSDIVCSWGEYMLEWHI